jgi:predicted transcriptional regulator
MSVLTLEHSSVQKVLEIAEELVKENKVLTIKILYNRAKHRLKIPRNGLLKIIQLLIDRRIIVDGSRFTRDSVLSHDIRNFIYSIIENEIGIHFSELKRKVDSVSEISTGQLIWHLEMLLKFDLIKKVKFTKYTIFLPIDIEDQLGIIYFLLKDEINLSILKLLSEKSNLQKSNLYETLEEEREKVYYHIKTLQDYGIIMVKADILSIVPEIENTIKFIFKNMHIQLINED